MRFDILDVFAPRRFAGNQLAVVRDAAALTDADMLAIARETNFSETTFVMDEAAEPRVRIFTPGGEVPFAGHPTLGTAVLLMEGRTELTLRLNVGPMRVWREGDDFWMRQNPPTYGPGLDARAAARLLGLEVGDIAGPVEVVSTGLPHAVVPLVSLAALRRAKLNDAAYADWVKESEAKCLFPFALGSEGGAMTVTARQFAPFYGIVEDPATGSGNGCLAAYLSRHAVLGTRVVEATVSQGAQVGRPALVRIRADGARVEVGGQVQHVVRGTLVGHVHSIGD